MTTDTTSEPIVRHVTRHALSRARERWRDLAELCDADLTDVLRDRAERARYYDRMPDGLFYAHRDMVLIVSPDDELVTVLTVAQFGRQGGCRKRIAERMEASCE